jgi:glycosyltransferase involved in cell wall biosynthesis
MATDVIIPVRNEEHTVLSIVTAFLGCPHTRSVLVAVDADTTDNTAVRARMPGVNVIMTGERGKGQVIKKALNYVESKQVVLCDGDLVGFTPFHADCLLTRWAGSYTIGVPDLTLSINDILSSEAVRKRPEWLTGIVANWPLISGERCVPVRMLRGIDLHGYLTEVQINAACAKVGIRPRFVQLTGVRAPFIMSDKRIEEMERDREWGRSNGVLPR